MTLGIRVIKVLDITFITAIYTILCIAASVLIDKSIGEFDAEKAGDKSTFRLFMEIIGGVSIIAVTAYGIRNIVGAIPSPFEGVGGFEHARVKELSGGVVAGFALFYYQYNLRAKIDYVINERIW